MFLHYFSLYSKGFRRRSNTTPISYSLEGHVLVLICCDPQSRRTQGRKTGVRLGLRSCLLFQIQTTTKHQRRSVSYRCQYFYRLYLNVTFPNGLELFEQNIAIKSSFIWLQLLMFMEIKRISQSINPSINQSINPSINQWINQCNQSMQSIDASSNQRNQGENCHISALSKSPKYISKNDNCIWLVNWVSTVEILIHKSHGFPLSMLCYGRRQLHTNTQ